MLFVAILKADYDCSVFLIEEKVAQLDPLIICRGVTIAGRVLSYCEVMPMSRWCLSD